MAKTIINGIEVELTLYELQVLFGMQTSATLDPQTLIANEQTTAPATVETAPEKAPATAPANGSIFKREVDPIMAKRPAQVCKGAAEKALAAANIPATVTVDGCYFWIEKPESVTLEAFAAFGKRLSNKWRWSKNRAKNGTPAYYAKFKPSK